MTHVFKIDHLNIHESTSKVNSQTSISIKKETKSSG